MKPSTNNGSHRRQVNQEEEVDLGRERGVRSKQRLIGAGMLGMTLLLAAAPALPGSWLGIAHVSASDGCPNVLQQGSGNTVLTSVNCATVGGGSSNHGTADLSVISGGTTNTASGVGASVGGGGYNTASNYFANISGGGFNTVSNYYTSVGGGVTNTASGYAANVSGGGFNKASGSYSTVSGGGRSDANNDATGNRATDNYATVGGGGNNQAGDNAGSTSDHPYATVGGGFANTASGSYATVPGGYMNAATNNTAFAAGRQAKAKHAGSFVWGDYQAADISSTANNQFIVRAGGGIWLGTTSTPSIPAGRFIQTSTGAYLSSGGTWTNSSDKNLKTNIAAIDPQAILAKVASMPVAEWNYRAEDAAVKHIGPMAQDFAAAFGLGEDNKHIATVDADGVALAAIQGLNAKVDAVTAENTQLKQQMASINLAPSRQMHIDLSLSWSVVLLLVSSLTLILLSGLALAWMRITRRQIAN